MRVFRTVIVATGIILAASEAHPLVWYVDAAGGDPSNDATSWTQAVPRLAQAADAAEASGDQNPTFWVTVTPQEGQSGDDRVLNLAGYSFSSVAIFGGFNGTENSPNGRPEGQRTALTFPEGGSLVAGILSNIPELVLDALRFVRLDADAQGAGLYVTAGEVSANNCVFTECEADEGGGAIALRLGSSLEASNCVFTDNGASGGGPSVPASGGDILLSSEPGAQVSGNAPTATLIDCRLAGAASATAGGSIYVGEGAAMTATRCTINSGLADEQGGGIFAASGPGTAITLADSDVSNCMVNNGPGGGFWAGDGATVLLLDSRIANCVGTEGGGVWLEGCTGEVTGTDFINNETGILSGAASANPSGGGMLMDNCALPVTDCRFIGNRAGNEDSMTSFGGGLVQEDSLNNAPLSVTNTVFEGNRSVSGNGGGLYSEFSELTVDGCTFTGNRAQQGGGLRAVTQGEGVGMRGTTLRGNVANAAGGADFVGGEQHVAQCRFDSNGAPGAGTGGLRSTNAGTVQVINSLFTENVGLNTTAISIASASQAPRIAYCTFAGHSQWHSFQREGVLIRLDGTPQTMEVTSCILDGPQTFAAGTGDRKSVV